MMDNKSIDVFYQVFRYVGFTENQVLEFSKQPSFANTLTSLSNGINDVTYNALDSIKTNLWGLAKEDRELYFKKIIRGASVATKDIIKNDAITSAYHNGDLEMENADTFSLYIIRCWFYIHQFKQSLDVISAEFNIDIFKIQNEIGITFIDKRYIDALDYYGYDELFEIKELTQIVDGNEETFEYRTLKVAKSIPIDTLPTKTESLNTSLSEYGFYNLDKTKGLSKAGRGALVDLLVKNKSPYQIAMFNYLEFLKHISKEHAPTIKKRNEIVSKIIGVSFDTVKNNINYLDRLDDHDRYTSFNFKDTVINDYNAL